MRIAIDRCVGIKGRRVLEAAGHEIVVEAEEAEPDRDWFARALAAGVELVVACDRDLSILSYDHGIEFFKALPKHKGTLTAQLLLQRYPAPRTQVPGDKGAPNLGGAAAHVVEFVGPSLLALDAEGRTCALAALASLCAVAPAVVANLSDYEGVVAALQQATTLVAALRKSRVTAAEHTKLLAQLNAARADRDAAVRNQKLSREKNDRRVDAAIANQDALIAKLAEVESLAEARIRQAFADGHDSATRQHQSAMDTARADLTRVMPVVAAAKAREQARAAWISGPPGHSALAVEYRDAETRLSQAVAALDQAASP